MENRNTLYKMTKTVTLIDCPKEWESESDWDSHRPLLWLTCKNIDGGLIEFGSGDGSTSLLRKELGSKFMSFDNNKEWCEKTGSRFTNSYLEIGVNGAHDNLKCVFVDCAPAELRKPLIEKWQDTHIIVVHDTEIGSNYVYNLANTLPLFKYRVDYRPTGKPHTTVVSNTVNVCEWIP